MSAEIGRRLREERTRLGLNQADFGTLAGMSKRSMVAAEKGESPPKATRLACWAKHGVDVLYIVTGRRALGSYEVTKPRMRLHVDAEQRAALGEDFISRLEAKLNGEAFIQIPIKRATPDNRARPSLLSLIGFGRKKGA